MEAATAVAPVAQSNDEKVEAVMETTGTGINKTNIEYAIHHFEQAHKSLDRSMGRLNAMTNGKSGVFATKLTEARDFGYTAEDAFIDALRHLNSTLAEIEELYG